MTKPVASLLLLLGIAFMSATAAQETPKAAAEPSATVPAPHPVTATIISDPVNRVGEPVFVTLTLKNVSTASQIVRNFVVRVDGSATGRFSPNGDCSLNGLGELTLAPGDSYSQTCRFPVVRAAVPNEPTPQQATETGWLRQYWYQDLFSADLRLLVDVNLEELGSRRFFPVITIKANETSVFIGGMVGAMLLALFVLVERLLKNPEVREQWARSLMVTILMGLRGGLLAIIALLLGRTTQGAGSPVSLTVVDFAGGILIGLFSYPLASWISSTLKVDGAFVPAPTPSKGATERVSPAPGKDD